SVHALDVVMFGRKPKQQKSTAPVVRDTLRINLLDWREAQREQRRRNFLGGLTFAVLLCAAAIAGVTLYFYGHRIDVQQRRNAYLQQQIDAAKQKMTELKKIKAERADLLRRMGIIEDLQQSRAWIVHFFDEVTDSVPGGVFLLSLQQDGNTTTLKGVAESNARVSDYMVNLDKSPYLEDPRLIVIKSRNNGDHRYADFTLRIENEYPDNPAQPPAQLAQARQ